MTDNHHGRGAGNFFRIVGALIVAVGAMGTNVMSPLLLVISIAAYCIGVKIKAGARGTTFSAEFFSLW